MTKQRFNKVSDFIYLDEETFQRMLPDLIAWHQSTRNLISTFKGLGYIAESAKVNVGDFVWVDDGKPGNCAGVNLKISGTELVTENGERLKQPQKILSAEEVTEPGWYWWTPGDVGTIEIVEVDYEYTPGQPKRLVFFEVGKADSFQLSGRFIGPMKAPEV